MHTLLFKGARTLNEKEKTTEEKYIKIIFLRHISVKYLARSRGDGRD